MGRQSITDKSFRGRTCGRDRGREIGHAFTRETLRLNLDEGTAVQEETRVDWARMYLGGTGLGTRYPYGKVLGGVDPLVPRNVLVSMTGPLTGTASPGASRYAGEAKSPLTGIWGQSKWGGAFGPALKRSRYVGVICEDASPQPVYLQVVESESDV